MITTYIRLVIHQHQKELRTYLSKPLGEILWNYYCMVRVTSIQTDCQYEKRFCQALSAQRWQYAAFRYH
jgi:hypothetical protein